MRTNYFHHAPQAKRKVILLLVFLCVVAVLAGCSETASVSPSQLTADVMFASQPISTSVTILPVTVLSPTVGREARPLLPNSSTTAASGRITPTTVSVAPIVVQTVAARPTSTEAHQVACTLVAGNVVEGGDTTPAGLSGTPRRYVYKISIDSGTIATVSYRAHPPSPTGDKVEIRLDFHAGQVLVGDYLKACGTFDQSTQMLLVSEGGHYIETYSSKP